MANSQNVLAGLAGFNGTPDLIHVADVATGLTLPTDAISAPAAAFKSMGYITTNGLADAIQTTTNDIDAYGVTSPVRTLLTNEVEEFTLAGEETNSISLAIYNRLTIASLASAGPDGSLAVTRGPARDPHYALVVSLTDGLNRGRLVVPNATLVNRAQRVIQKGQNIEWGFTFRANLDTNGVAVYEYWNLVSLGAS